jgi:hypothetical protein
VDVIKDALTFISVKQHDEFFARFLNYAVFYAHVEPIHDAAAYYPIEKPADFPKNKINWCGSVSSVFEKSVGQI